MTLGGFAVKYLVRVVAVAALVLVSQVVQAGSQQPTTVPTLSEAGLAVFAISLAGVGVALIRRRRR